MSAPGTEPPTARRLREARQYGRVARSSMLTSLGIWLALAICAELFGDRLWRAAQAWLEQSLVRATDPNHATPTAVLAAVAEVVWPSMGVLVGVAALGALLDFAQVGPLFAWRTLTRSDQRSGAVSGSLPLRAAFAVAALIAAFAWMVVAAQSLGPLSADLVGATLGVPIWRFARTLLLALCLGAAVDLASARARHLRSLFTSRSEARRDLREAEGAPEMRRERTRMQRSVSRQGDAS